MGSSSSSAAARPEGNERNMVAAADPQPPPPPPADRHAVFLDQLFWALEPEPPPRPFVRRELPFVCRTLAWGLLAFLAITSFVVLMWLIFHPILPQLNVASVTLSTVAVTTAAATAECNITFLLTNPNRHLTTIYDRMEFALFYPSQQVLLSKDYKPRFVQPGRSRVTIETNLSFNGVDLGSDVVKAMKVDVDRGSLNLGIKVLAVVKYRNGKWKTRSHYMRAYCVGVSFAFASSNKSGLFLNPYQECELHY